MRRKAKAFFILAALMAALTVACTSTTDAFRDPVYGDSSIRVEEKLECAGGVKMSVDAPEAIRDGGAWLCRLTELVKKARSHIFIAVEEGSWSEDLGPFFSLLSEKAISGVDVHLMIDGMSENTGAGEGAPLCFLRESGVHLHIYHPLSAIGAISPWDYVHRNRLGIFIFDGEVCAIGGRGLSEGSLARPDESMYIFSSSELVSALTRDFVSIWNDVSVEHLDPEKYGVFAHTDASIPAWLFIQENDSKQNIADPYAALIDSASSEILIASSNPVADDDMLESLLRAVLRGVDVKVISSMDSEGLAAKGMKEYLPKLIGTGAEVIMEVPEGGAVSSRENLMVVDGRWTAIGNGFSWGAMEHSLASCLVLDSHQFAEEEKSHIAAMTSEGFMEVDMDKAKRWKDEDGSHLGYLTVLYGGER